LQSDRCELRVLGRGQWRNVVETGTRCASFGRSQTGGGFGFSCVLSAGLGEALDACK
jgi:hypothetical protein